MEFLYNIIILGFLFSLVAVPVGIIRPSLYGRFLKSYATRKRIFVGGMTVLVLLCVLIGVTEPASVKQKRIADEQSAQQKAQLDQKVSTPVVAKAKKVAPVVTRKIETEEQPVPFASKTIQNSSIDKGMSVITTEGVNGTKTLTYQVTYTGGKRGERKLIKEEVTQEPVTQVTTVGTYVKPAPKPVATPAPSAASTNSGCDPNYSGACVPIASDVDCAGGTGNGK